MAASSCTSLILSTYKYCHFYPLKNLLECILLLTLKLFFCFHIKSDFDFFLITGFLVFINLYCVRYGALALQEIFDSIQPKLVCFVCYI